MPDRRDSLLERPAPPAGSSASRAGTHTGDGSVTPIAWPGRDALTDVLDALRTSEAVCCTSYLRAPWGIDVPPIASSLMVHAVQEGALWVEHEGRPALELRAGDVALLPHAAGHRLAWRAGAATVPLAATAREARGPHHERLQLGGAGAETRVLCLTARRRDEAAHLVRQLPSVIVARREDVRAPTLAATLTLLEEAHHDVSAASAGTTARLVDAVVLHAVHAWVARGEGTDEPCLALLREPGLLRAARAIAADPAGAWSIARLAQVAGMSRSTFASRFTIATGVPVMQYVAHVRMRQAATALEREDVSIGELAERVGYDSEAAFARAFKRVLGVSPGEARRRARGAPAG